MTENEIIKALERMSEEDPNGFSSDILDLINRQKAEIEALKKTLTDLTKAIAKIDEYSQYERARTAGEFAGRLKRNYSKALFYISDYETLIQHIDDIVNQMTGGKDVEIVAQRKA